MKSFLIFLLCFSFGHCLSQTSSPFAVQQLSGSTTAITLKQKATDEFYFTPFRLIDTRSVKDRLTINISTTNGTAINGSDWEFVSAPVVVINPADAHEFAVGIKVKPQRVSVVPISFKLQFDINPAAGASEKNECEFKIMPAGVDELPDTAKWNVRIVTGSNFDFFDVPAFKNFAGDLNIFLPDLFQKKRSGDKKPLSFGFQAGFFNFRYFDGDSSNGNFRTDRYLLNKDIEKVIPGTSRYVRETYALNSRTNFNTVGAYLNPMIRLSHGKKWLDAYMNIHFEMLWRTQIFNFIKNPIQKDTLTYTTTDSLQELRIQATQGLRPTYNKYRFEDLYLGVGFPLKIDVKKLFEFFITPTLGVTYFQNQTSDITTRGSIITRTFRDETSPKLFLLTKAQLVTRVAPIDIALGGEFRHVSGQRAFYAVYLGATLSLDKFKK